MDRFIITFRSITFAQRGERALRKLGLDCTLLRTPRELTSRGCGYCLRLRGRDALAAAEVLREQEIPFVKVYALGEKGKMEERAL